MVVKKVLEIGPYAFMAGIAVSAVAGFMWPHNASATLLVAILGVLVGMLNIKDKEVPGFLFASIALMVSAGSLGTVFGQFPVLTTAAPAFFSYIATFAAPAAGIVSFKQLWMLAKD